MVLMAEDSEEEQEIEEEVVEDTEEEMSAEEKIAKRRKEIKELREAAKKEKAERIELRKAGIEKRAKILKAEKELLKEILQDIFAYNKMGKEAKVISGVVGKIKARCDTYLAEQNQSEG